MGKQYTVISNWSTLIENFSQAPLQFYELVEAGIRQRQIPDIKVSRTEMKEGGIFSAKRQYLTVERKNYCFDVCGAPFGTGFFVSWWLTSSMGVLQRFLLVLAHIPGIGDFIAPRVSHVTFYQHDTTDMFQKSVHNAVLEVLDQITKTKGLKAIPELERKPIMSEFYKPKSLRR